MSHAETRPEDADSPEGFADLVFRRTNVSRFSLLPHQKIRRRLVKCGGCQYRQGGHCTLANDVDEIAIRASIPTMHCPRGLWVDRDEANNSTSEGGYCYPYGPPPEPCRDIRVCWFLADLARGGIICLLRTLLPYFSGTHIKPVAVLFYSLYHLDEDAARELSRYVKLICTGPVDDCTAQKYPFITFQQGRTPYQTAIEACEIINLCGLSESVPLPPRLKWHGRTVICQAHGVAEWTQASLAYCEPFATHYFAVSETVRAILPKDKPNVVIDSPVDLNRLVPTMERGKCRQMLLETGEHRIPHDNGSLCGDAPWFLYFGRFAPEKRLGHLAESIATLIRRAKQRDCPVRDDCMERLTRSIGVFVGDGWNYDHERAAIEHHLEGHCLFVRWSPHIGNILEAADCVVCTSEGEGGPLMNIEALIAAVPVVSTPVGVMPTLQGYFERGEPPRLMYHPVQHHDSPYSVAEKLAWAVSLRSPGRRSSFDHRVAEITARRFSVVTVARQWVAYLTQLAQDRTHC